MGVTRDMVVRLLQARHPDLLSFHPHHGLHAPRRRGPGSVV
jgi:hypothetical protein